MGIFGRMCSLLYFLNSLPYVVMCDTNVIAYGDTKCDTVVLTPTVFLISTGSSGKMCLAYLMFYLCHGLFCAVYYCDIVYEGLLCDMLS